jgi:hypothetical protein
VAATLLKGIKNAGAVGSGDWLGSNVIMASGQSLQSQSYPDLSNYQTRPETMSGRWSPSAENIGHHLSQANYSNKTTLPATSDLWYEIARKSWLCNQA